MKSKKTSQGKKEKKLIKKTSKVSKPVAKKVASVAKKAKPVVQKLSKPAKRIETKTVINKPIPSINRHHKTTKIPEIFKDFYKE